MTNEELSVIMRNTFMTPDGKKALEFFMDEYYDRTSVVKGDPHMTYFFEGQRSVVSTINEYIKGE